MSRPEVPLYDAGEVMQQPGDGRSSRTAADLPVSGFGARHLLSLAILSLGLAACAHSYVQGNVVDPDLLSQIKPGELSKQQVQSLIGTPSSVSTFDQNTWYYISKETQRYAFFDPELINQKVIEIDFDKSGKVLAIHKFGAKDARDVELVERTTPTRGKSLGVLDQLWATMVKQFGSSNNGIDATKVHPDPYGG
jgi:outer membrane protein assembly factor BamE (lipoprotein component of BamABCDE complex)